MRTPTLTVRVQLPSGWNTYVLFNTDIVNFVWKTDKAESIVLLIFVLWRCLNLRWLRGGAVYLVWNLKIAILCYIWYDPLNKTHYAVVWWKLNYFKYFNTSIVHNFDWTVIYNAPTKRLHCRVLEAYFVGLLKPALNLCQFAASL